MDHCYLGLLHLARLEFIRSLLLYFLSPLWFARRQLRSICGWHSILSLLVFQRSEPSFVCLDLNWVNLVSYPNLFLRPRIIIINIPWSILGLLAISQIKFKVIVASLLLLATSFLFILSLTIFLRLLWSFLGH